MSKELEILFKRNDVIKAKYEFTTIQNRILNKVFFDIQKDKKKYGTFTMEQMKELTGNKNNYSLPAIKEILDDMMKNDITQIKKGKEWTKATVISAYRIKAEEGIVEVELSRMFQEMIIEYNKLNQETGKKQGFTTINVTKYISLNGTNSQRIYELLRMWSGTKKVIEYTVDEIRELLCLDGKYEIFNNFKVKVIEAAVKDINKKGLMNIAKIEYVKVGRKVKSIKFFVDDLEPKNYDFNNKGNLNIADHKDLISVCAASTGLVTSSINKLVKEYGIEEVVKACDKFKTASNVKAPLKYLKAILENKEDIKPRKKSTFDFKGQKTIDNEILEIWNSEWED